MARWPWRLDTNLINELIELTDHTRMGRLKRDWNAIETRLKRDWNAIETRLKQRIIELKRWKYLRRPVVDISIILLQSWLPSHHTRRAAAAAAATAAAATTNAPENHSSEWRKQQGSISFRFNWIERDWEGKREGDGTYSLFERRAPSCSRIGVIVVAAVVVFGFVSRRTCHLHISRSRHILQAKRTQQPSPNNCLCAASLRCCCCCCCCCCRCSSSGWRLTLNTRTKRRRRGEGEGRTTWNRVSLGRIVGSQIAGKFMAVSNNALKRDVGSAFVTFEGLR